MAWAKSLLFHDNGFKVHLALNSAPVTPSASATELSKRWPWGWQYPLADFSSWDGLTAELQTWATPRQQEWLAGRWALTRVLDHLKHPNPFHLSHSHTHGQVLTAVVEDSSNEIRSIGVDLESKDRIVSAKLQAQNPVPPLLEWVAKEACFKALRTLEHPNQVSVRFKETPADSPLSAATSSYPLYPISGTGHGPASVATVSFAVVPDPQFWIVLAWAYANSERPPSTTKV